MLFVELNNARLNVQCSDSGLGNRHDFIGTKDLSYYSG